MPISPKRPPERSPKRAPARSRGARGKGPPRISKPRTLMKVAPGDGLHSWVTLQLPAWLMVILAVLLLLGLLAVLSSPDLSARLSLVLLELSKWLRRNPDP